MKTDDVKRETLYDIGKQNGDWFKMEAFFTGVELVLLIHDFSNMHEDIFGDDESEVFYVFDSENVEKLISVFHTTDLLASLSEFYDGKMRDKEFFDLCRENNISFNQNIR